MALQIKLTDAAELVDLIRQQPGYFLQPSFLAILGQELTARDFTPAETEEALNFVTRLAGGEH